MDKIYVELLKERYKELKDMKIGEMSDDEINEFINLKKEVINVLPVFKEIKKMLEPYTDAITKYSHNVLKK